MYRKELVAMMTGVGLPWLFFLSLLGYPPPHAEALAAVLGFGFGWVLES